MGGHPDPKVKEVVGGGGGGGNHPQKIFWPFGPQFGLKIRGAQAPGSWMLIAFLTFTTTIITLSKP